MKLEFELVGKYVLGAMLATILNIVSQMVSMALYDGAAALMLSMLVGTFVGLLFKYWFDKRWIFEFKAEGLRDDGLRFVRYSAFGIVTTAIFWCSELGFEWLFGGGIARYVGAVLGLAVGYLLKYLLDRRFVFRHARVSI